MNFCRNIIENQATLSVINPANSYLGEVSKHGTKPGPVPAGDSARRIQYRNPGPRNFRLKGKSSIKVPASYLKMNTLPQNSACKGLTSFHFHVVMDYASLLMTATQDAKCETATISRSTYIGSISKVYKASIYDPVRTSGLRSTLFHCCREASRLRLSARTRQKRFIPRLGRVDMK